MCKSGWFDNLFVKKKYEISFLCPCPVIDGMGAYKCYDNLLWWFLSIALGIPTAHDFHIIWACAHEHMQIQNVTDFPQAKLNSEINACFLFYKHDDVYILYYMILM